MSKRLASLLFLMLFAAFGTAVPASALGLKVAPLEYNVSLKKGEKQKGFIDLSNPAGVTVHVKTSVQAFRQTDDRGSLTFFDDEQVSAGVTLDLEEFELGPHEAVRMYFQVDGTKLPQGDVFAAIFFTTQPTRQGTGVTELLRLGTILSITNGTPGQRQAEIAGFTVPFVQFGGDIKGTYLVKNTGDPEKSTGFYPTVMVEVEPFRQELIQRGRLVFAGRTRENTFELQGSRIGFYKVSVSHGGSKKEQWVLAIDGTSLAIFALVAVAGAGAFLGWKKTRRKHVENLRINR